MTDRRFSHVEVFDLDGTITRTDTYAAFLIYVLIRRPARWFRCPLLAAAVFMHKAGVRDNTWLKGFFLYHVIGGLHKDQAAGYAHGFLKAFLPKAARPQALSAIRELQAQNRYLILMSASFDLYVTIIGQALGFDDVICTKAGISRYGTITGKLAGENCYGRVKAVCFKELRRDFPRSRFTVYTDHHSDIPIITAADEAVAVNPTPKLKAYAVSGGIPCKDWN